MDPTKVRKVRVYALFDYYLQYRLKLKMKTLAVLEIDTPSGASRIRAEGPLNLVQKYPTLVDSIARDVNFKNPLERSNFAEFDWNTIVTRYNARSENTKYDAEILVQP